MHSTKKAKKRVSKFSVAHFRGVLDNASGMSQESLEKAPLIPVKLYMETEVHLHDAVHYTLVVRVLLKSILLELLYMIANIIVLVF